MITGSILNTNTYDIWSIANGVTQQMLEIKNREPVDCTNTCFKFLHNYLFASWAVFKDHYEAARLISWFLCGEDGNLMLADKS